MSNEQAKLAASAGFLQHDYLPLGALRPERVVYSALPQIILSSTTVTGEASPVITMDGQRNTTVFADVVRVHGRIVSPGCDVTIVARKLIFEGKDPGIVTDGASGAGPRSTEAPAKRPRAEDGAKGEIKFLIREKNGEPGKPGNAKDGEAAKNGADGDSGRRAGDIEIDVEEWVGDALLSAVGGEGRAAQDGESGQDGGNGGDGVDQWVVDGERHKTHCLVSPGPGGKGGDAGFGGAGGAGGDAGKITVRTVSAVPAGVKIVAAGGKRGADGKDGAPGAGGLEGKNGDSSLTPPIALEVFSLSGASGEVRHGAAIAIRTRESAVGTQNVLGAFKDKTECYFWDAVDEQKQGWKIERVDGTGDGKVRYGDRIYLTNLSFGQRLVRTTAGAFQTNEWLTTVEGANEHWVLEAVPPASAGQVIQLGQLAVLRCKDGRCVTATPSVYARWFPMLATSPPAQTRADPGGVHPRPKDRDPWTHNKAGAEATPEQATITTPGLAAYWHPAQAWLQVDRLKGQYLTVDLGGAEFASFGKELFRWQTLLSGVSALPAPEPLTPAAVEREELAYAAGRVASLLGTYSAGQDYFGNQRDYAPAPSYRFYGDQATERLADLRRLEAKYKEVLQVTADNDALKSKAAAAFNEAVMTGEAATEERTKAIAELFVLQAALGDASTKVTALTEPLRVTSDHVTAFKKEVDASFGCDLASFLQGLEMMLFVPPVERNEDKTWGLSGSGVAMAGAQLAKIIQTGVDTIKTADGELVEKSKIVTSVTRLGKDVLASAQQIFQDEKGRKYDLGGPGILATLDEWEELVAKFIGLGSAQALQRDIRRLGDAVRARGKAVTAFNQKLFEVLALSDVIADREATRTKALRVAADLNDPTLPSVLGFLSRQYAERKDAVIESIYLGNRAYAYWKLDDGTVPPTHDKNAHGLNVFRETLAAKHLWEAAQGDVYGALDATVLDACRSTLNQWFESDLVAYAAFPQPFPQEPGTDGFRIVIRDPAAIEEFRTLKSHGLAGPKVHQLRFTITDHGKNGTFTNEHLKGLADVRLQTFRVFLNGAYRTVGAGNSDTLIQVTFQHDGTDRNFTVKGQSRSFSRPDLPHRTFMYDGGQDAVRYVSGNTGKFTGGYIEMDGSIGCGGTLAELAESGPLAKFAGVGPFAEWTITVDPAQNGGLVLGPKLEIEIQLVGVARTRE